MNLDLENRLALVTGSIAGIGYAIADALVREGARVVINGSLSGSRRSGDGRAVRHGTFRKASPAT